MIRPPASISNDVAANGSSRHRRGATRGTSRSPTSRAEQTQSAIPHQVRAARGLREHRDAGEADADAREHLPGQPLAPASRSTTSQSGTDAMISDARPVGHVALREEEHGVRARQQAADHDARA